MNNNRTITLISLALLLLSQQLLAENDARQAEIAERGAQVMPFSLPKTLHQFSKTDTGGIQRVVVRNAEDQEQIQLIRRHLGQLAVQFRQGDYSGPTAIHGADMPGLAQLKAAKPDSIKIDYAEEATGASLTFSSQDSKLIAAVHQWFDAQLRDHGDDAMSMHHMHHLHHPN